jgi:hypothetical protein
MSPTDTDGTDGERPVLVGLGGHATCGVVGLGAALAVLAATYSALVAMASLVPLLSTTWLVFAGVLVWLFVWLVLDLALLGWRGRRRAESPSERGA